MGHKNIIGGEEDDQEDEEDEAEEDGKYKLSGGYPVKYLIDKKQGMYLGVGGGEGGGETLSRFNHLVVPCGLVLDDTNEYFGGNNSKGIRYTGIETQECMLNEKIFDKLFGQVATLRQKSNSKKIRPLIRVKSQTKKR
jgi:hypothetical protein